MSPESKRFFGLTKEALIEGLGASEQNLEELKGEAQQALATSQYENAERLTQRLNKLSSLRDDLLSATDTITPVLEKYGFLDEDVDFEIPEVKEEAREPERIGTRKPKKYIDDASPTIAKALITKTPEGDFQYNNLEQIGSLILQEELRENAEALKDASLYVYVTVKDLAEKVPEFAEDSGKATMRGLGKEALSRLRNPAWEPFYKTVAELYGELSPQDFINSVVLRIVPKKQEAKEEVEKRKAEKRRIIEKLTPIDLRPVDELCLCNKLLRPETIARIKTEVLNGQEPEVIARKHGWKSDLTTPEAFETSRKKMAKRRDNRIPTEEEARFSNWVIQKLLLRLSESRRGWHMIDKEYTAFRFVFYLMPELRGESNSVGKLIDALYPKKEYLTDASRSFLLLGIDES